MNRRLTDRAQAGRALGSLLAQQRFPAPPVVLALPRGGVPVGAEVALALHAPLDLLLVRKIGAPGQPELAVAAVVDGNPPQVVIDELSLDASGGDRHWVDREVPSALQEIARRRQVYLAGREPVPLAGRTVIVVDDGVATGTTVRAALRVLRGRAPARLLLALPVAPRDTLAALRREGCETVCLAEPEPFRAIGEHYDDFHQLDDAEVLAALAAAAAPVAGPAVGGLG